MSASQPTRIYVSSNAADEGTNTNFTNFLPSALINVKTVDLLYFQTTLALYNLPPYESVFYFTQSGTLQTVPLTTTRAKILKTAQDLVDGLNADLGAAGYNPANYYFSWNADTARISFTVTNGLPISILAYNTPTTPNSISFRLGFTGTTSGTTTLVADSPPKIVRTTGFYLLSSINGSKSYTRTQTHTDRRVLAYIPLNGAAYGDLVTFTPQNDIRSLEGESTFSTIINTLDMQLVDDDFEPIPDMPESVNTIIGLSLSYFQE
jgi:hypothetical protein